MPSHEALSAVADVYTPLLALTALSLIGIAARKRQWRRAGRQLATIVSGLALAFGLMVLDEWFRIWPAFGLDYSTHTGVALVLVVFLVAWQAHLAALWIASLIAYLALMRYQDYHTVADMVTTVAVLIVPISWIAMVFRKRDGERAQP